LTFHHGGCGQLERLTLVLLLPQSLQLLLFLLLLQQSPLLLLPPVGLHSLDDGPFQ